MAIDMSTVKTIVNNANNKEVIKIEDSLGGVLWQKASPTATLYASLGYQETSSYISDAQGKLLDSTPDYFELNTSSDFPQMTGTAYDMTIFWTDGEYWYADNGSGGIHYRYDFATSTRTATTWNIGNFNVDGENIWTDGSDIYLGSSNGISYVFDKVNKTWSQITVTGDLSTVYGENIWTDGTDVYYLYSGSSYVLNKATKAWSSVSFTNASNITNSRGIWTDGTNIFYSNGIRQYQLNVATRTWVDVTRTYRTDRLNGFFDTGYGIYYRGNEGQTNYYKVVGNDFERFDFKKDNSSGNNVYVRGLMSSDPSILYPYLSGRHTTFKLLMFN